ncbi:hypothetical protein NEH83_29905 [Streptomyces sp. JUS-F4]|uniref:hypothetical protein n=1 Tax=Streptomyces sp. JUS-F4 TaxID=2951988 RepID=UPI002666D46C|nr:hypothetical protein [Streptomyces sp. JUS-F4]WKN18029.1 hypothetical protein NEH83_29905 [Streptomyces sp. JUS-F4]
MVSAIGATVIAVGAAAAAVVTDNMVPTISTPHLCTKGRVCQTDNKDVTYYMDSSGEFKLEAVDKSYVTAMLKGEYSPTDLVIKCDATPKFSGSAETDVVWQEGAKGLDDDAEGMAWCDDPVSGYKCDQQVIRIRGNGNYDPSITCHEMGHAVGLLHGGSAYPALPSEDSRLGCMIAHGYSSDLGSNNVSNINGTY